VTSETAHTDVDFRSLVETVPAIVFAARPDGTISYANAAWTAFSGLPVETILEAGWADVLHPDDAGWVGQAWLNAMTSATAFREEFRIRDHAGAYRWVVSSAVCAFDADGLPAAWYGTMVDVGEDYRSAQRRAILERLGVAFTQSLDFEQTAKTVVSAMCEEFADFAFVDVFDADGDLARAAVETGRLHADPVPFGRFAPPSEADRHPINVVLRTGRPHIVAHVDDRWKAETTWSAEHHAFLRSLPMASVVYVPMIAAGERVGVLTFGAAIGTGRSFTEADIDDVVEVARRAAVAIANSRLYRDLAASEARYRGIIDTAQEGIWIVDTDARTRYVNARLTEMLRYSADEMYGRRIYDFVEPSERDTLAQALQQHRTGGGVRVESRLLRKDGTIACVLVASNAIADADGTFAGSLGMFTDITERKAIETQYRLLAEATPQIVWTAGADGATTYVNEHWTATTGMPREAALEYGWFGLVHPADVEDLLDRWDGVRASGDDLDVECRLRREDGAYRWQLVRARARRDESGDVVEWLGTMTDVDATRRAADAMTFLADASEALASSLEVDRTFVAVANLAVRAFADACTIHVRDRAGVPQLVAEAHAEAAQRAGFSASVGADSPEWRTIAETIATSQPLYVPRVAGGPWASLGARSVMVVPLVARDTTLGALTLIAASGARSFAPDDLRLAKLLAKRVAVAIDNARLYGDERRLARMREVVARASEALGGSLDLDALLERFTALMVAELGEEATIRLVDGVSVTYRRSALPADAPLLRVTLRQHDVEIGTLELRRADPLDDDEIALVEELAARAAVAIENAQLYQREHRVAMTLQRAMLPAVLPAVEGLAFDAVYHPGATEAEIGGDWYDAIALPDGRVVVSIGDVTGRGLTAAVIMGRMRQAIDTLATYESDPVRLLDAADNVLRRAHPDAIVTALVGVVDPARSTLGYATAGHPMPFVRTPDGTIRQLPGRGLPLGLRDGRQPPTTTFALPPAALVVFFTDGLIESTRDIAEGERRVVEALRDGAVAGAADPAAALVARVLAGGARDDVAVLTLRNRDAAPSAEDWSLRWRFDPADRRRAYDVRETLIETLSTCGAAVDVPAAQLVFGELLSNAMRHAPGDVDVVLTWDDPATPVLHVVDQGPGYTFSGNLPPEDAESGRGLYLVRQLTRAFAVTKRSKRGSHARAVLLAGE
jgi:PAS domain S-box-containing protein